MRYVAALMLFASSAVGQTITSVSADSISTGGAIVVFGSGFGTKAAAAPAIWDDFESGTIGQDVVTPAIGSDYYYSPDVYAAGGIDGTQCAVSTSSVTSNPGLAHYWGTGTHRYAFASQDVKITGSNVLGANLKTLRLNSMNNAGSVDATHGYPNIALGKEVNSTTCYARCNMGLLPPYGNDLNAYTSWSFSDWTVMSVWIYTGTAGNTDGFSGRTINGTHAQETSRVQTSDSGNSSAMDGIRGANFSGYAQNSSTVYLDNIYADSSLARVELCNDDDYTRATVRRPLPPTAWAADEITATIYTYGFANGDSAWLFVHTAAGARSPSYGPVVIASAYDGEAPDENNLAVGAPTVTRGAGNAVTFEWNAPIPACTRYQVEIKIEGVMHTVEVVGTESLTINIPDASDIVVRVLALEEDSKRASTSAWVADSGT